MATRHRELIGPADPLEVGASWPLTPVDQFCLQWLIQGTWVFDTQLHAQLLKQGEEE